MLVKNWMDPRVITIEADESMQKAATLMKKNDLMMLPVMRKGQLVGVVTDRDIKKASVSETAAMSGHELRYLTEQTKISEIMSQDPITVPPDYTIEETAELLLAERISSVPVVDQDGKVVGTVSQADVFRVMISLAGLNKRGIQYGLIVKDQPGAVKEAEDVIRKYGGRVASILTSYKDAPKNHRKVYIRMYNIDRTRLDELKNDLKKAAQVLYMVDFRENKREVY